MKINSLSPDIVRNLFPVNSIIPKTSLFPESKDFLTNALNIRLYSIQLKMSSVYNKTGEISSEDYTNYLQFGNKTIKDLAQTIVNPVDSNDTKAWKIMDWVQNNITYKTDQENYKTGEYWALPTETISKKSGDCEDMAFLEHSLMLNAGVPWERIRTYGGYVSAGTNASSGGHGWTVYKRETDEEWVSLDACYYPEKIAIADRTPIRKDLKYQNDYFFVDLIETKDCSNCNTLRTLGGRINTYG